MTMPHSTVNPPPARPAALAAGAPAAQALLDLLPVGIYTCTLDGRIESFNRRAAALWGRAPRLRDPAELFCGSCQVYGHDGIPVSRADLPMAEVLRSGIAIADAETIVERPDGSRFVALVNITPLRDADGNLIGAVNCFQDITEQKHAQDMLRDSERHWRDLLEAMPVAIYTTDAKGRITFYNRAAVAMSGREPKLGTDQWCVTWKLYWPDGRPLPHDQCPMAIALTQGHAISGGVEAVAERPDGTRIPFIPYPTPLRDAAGEVIGAINMLVDITDRKKAEAHQKALLDELNHRVKNTLATVQSLAAQTMRGDRIGDGEREAFEARLLALSRVHNQLARERWESADLGRIVHDIVAPFGRERVSVDGASTKLASVAALPLAMVLHELATNAAKYGALSAPEGRLALGWKVEGVNGARRLRIDWRESGGPVVQPPVYRGFGSRLLERSVGQELRGSAQLDFDPAGVRCRLEIPLHAADA